MQRNFAQFSLRSLSSQEIVRISPLSTQHLLHPGPPWRPADVVKGFPSDVQASFNVQSI
jgi:hypothetical protein